MDPKEEGKPEYAREDSLGESINHQWEVKKTVILPNLLGRE